ncbi:MAG: hypothetical protein KDC36_01640 [Thermoleophilia bacterium]|nr:hypothetical protein [Thermoleophilia bacterium]
MSSRSTANPDAVADALWDRVRHLAATAERLSEAEAVGELDEDGRARLERTRVRLSRAAQRAQLADDLADQLADLRASRRRSDSGDAEQD